MKKLVFLGFVFFILGCGVNQLPAEKGSINWYKDLPEAKTQAQAQNKPILIDFYTDWCGWCKRLDKDPYAHKDVADFAKGFICVKINADEHRQLTKEYGVRGFPTTVFLRPDGVLIEAVPGYMPPDKFLTLMKRMLTASAQ